MKADASGVTRLKRLRQSGSSKLVFPKVYGKGVDVVLVNTAGGITGGDRFDLDICVAAEAALTLTTQAAERAYRAQRGEVGQVTTKVSVQAGGRLHWMPQELILFERCNLRRRLDITLESDARMVMVEPILFGRTAMGETLHDIDFRDRIKITRDERPLYLDGLDLCGDVATHLSRPAVANGAKAMASVVAVAPDSERHLKAIRALLPVSAGASILAKDVLVIRMLAHDGLDLRRSLIPVLEHLTHTALPTSWRL